MLHRHFSANQNPVERHQEVLGMWAVYEPFPLSAEVYFHHSAIYWFYHFLLHPYSQLTGQCPMHVHKSLIKIYIHTGRYTFLYILGNHHHCKSTQAFRGAQTWLLYYCRAIFVFMEWFFFYKDHLCDSGMIVSGHHYCLWEIYFRVTLKKQSP